MLFRSFTALAQLGGGEYPRPLAGAEITPPLPVVRVPQSAKDPASYSSVADALKALNAPGMDGQGIVEISDSGSHELASLVIQAPAEGVVVLRAAQGCRPVLELQRLELQGGPGSRIVLDGLVLHGGPVVVQIGRAHV